jgi:hypothetical protein
MIRQLITAVTLLIVTSAAVAQTVETTPNLITSGQTHTWTGIATGSYTLACPPNGGACSGGPGAMYDPNTNTIYFSYGQSTAAQTFAINQALANSGSGIVVQGYNYSWDILNNNNYRTDQSGTDTIIARVITFDPTGAIRRTDSWTYNTKFDWTTFSGSVNYVTPGPTSEFGNLRVEFTGSDSGFWGGYFGPQVRNVSIGLNYTVDPCVTNPQSSSSCPGFKTFYAIPDDGHAIVPIPFGFPFYGQIFTHSIFFDNGAVSFYSPTQPQRWGGGGFGLPAFNESMPSSFFYTIAPLKTDLIANQGRHYTQGDGTYLRYTWEDVSQFGRWDSRNTFSLEIRPTGYIGLQYGQIDIAGGWTSAIIGNASLGEYQAIQSSSSTTTNAINNWSISETIATDCSNPLVNVNCPGYANAFLQQQCTIRSNIYPGCPGAAEEFALCEANPYRNTAWCPTYQTVNAECVNNPLTHWFCPLYQQTLDTVCVTDPITNNLCPGYQLAYECSQNPLYATQCPGYTEAYALTYIVNSSSSNTPVMEEPAAVTAVEQPVTVIETAAPAATASPAEPAAPVQLIAEQAPAAVQAAATAPAPAKTEPAAAAPRTTRQALAEQRLAAAREQAAKAAQDNPDAVAAEMDAADSLEQQAAIQNTVLGAMGFVPGFDAYGRAVLPDGVGYRPFEIYPGQRNIDTPAARGLVGRSDRIHEEMVNEQYR